MAIRRPSSLRLFDTLLLLALQCSFALFLTALVVSFVANKASSPGSMRVSLVVAAVGAASLAGFLVLFAALRHVRRRAGHPAWIARQRRRGRCPACSYPSRGRADPCCPECGWRPNADETPVNRPTSDA